MTEQVTVLYVGGHGRSGSTILAQTLGQIPGFVNGGEQQAANQTSAQYAIASVGYPN